MGIISIRAPALGLCKAYNREGDNSNGDSGSERAYVFCVWRVSACDSLLVVLAFGKTKKGSDINVMFSYIHATFLINMPPFNSPGNPKLKIIIFL